MELLEIIKEAIKSKKPISFKYEKPDKIKGERIGNPHAIYYTGDDNILVDIFQTSGASDTPDNLPDWRQFYLEFIKDVNLLKDEPSFDVADGYDSHSPRYQKAIVKI